MADLPSEIGDPKAAAVEAIDHKICAQNDTGSSSVPKLPQLAGEAHPNTSPRASVALTVTDHAEVVDSQPQQRSDQGRHESPDDLRPLADIFDFLFRGSPTRSQSSTPKVKKNRFVGYRRNSTTLQTQTSQPRQEGGIEEYANRLGLIRVAPDFFDAGVSGVTAIQRPEFLAMMDMARRDDVDIIAIEDLDRFSRSLPNALAFFEELESYGVELHSIKHGKLDTVHVMIMGYMASEGRKRLMSLLAGGKRLAVTKGKQMGIPVYGYAKSPNDTGDRIIVEDRAEIARRIYAMAIAGVGTPTIATTLSEEGIPNPRQCARLDRNRGVSTDKSEGWSATQVRNLIMNPIMMGVLVWGKTIIKRDVRDNEIRIIEKRDPSEVIIGRSRNAGIVDEATWVAANQALRGRFFGRGSEQTRATVHLLTPSIRCACGSSMHAIPQFGKTYYKCVSARSNDLDRCSFTKGIRLDWLEGDILRLLRDTILDEGDNSVFTEKYTKQCGRINADRKRLKDKVLQEITKYQDLLDRSVIDTLIAGLSSATIEGLRRRWENELSSLRLKKMQLGTMVDPKQGFERLDTMAKGINHLIANVPNKPTTPDQIGLAKALRDLIPVIVVNPPDELANRRVAIKVDRTAMFIGHDETEHELENFSILINEEARLRQEVTERHQREDVSTQTVFTGGETGLPDDAWALVQDLVSDERLEGDIKPRMAVEGVLSLLKTGGKFTRLPTVLGDPETFMKAVRRLIYSGAWDRIIAALRQHRPELLNGADLRRMETTTWKRQPPEKGAFQEPAPGARQELIGLLASSTDGEEKVRFKVALAFLDGRGRADVARELELSPGWVSNLTNQYRRGGAAALIAKIPPKELWKKRRLSPEQQTELLELARAGIDPDRLGKDGNRVCLRHIDLIRICKDRYQVGYTLTGMISLIRKAGIDLQQTTKAAFRGSSIKLDNLPLKGSS